MEKGRKLANSFKKFAKYGTKEYHTFNGTEKSVFPLVVEYKNCTVVGTWHLHRTYNHKNWVLIKDAIQKAVLDYTNKTPKDKQFVMVEGFSGGKINMPFNDLEAAMKNGEPMGVLFLAKEYNVSASSPEPTKEESIRYLMLKEFTKDEVLLFFISRQMTSIEPAKLNKYLLDYVSYLIKGSENNKSKEPKNTKIMDIILKMNILFEKLYGKPMLKIESGAMISNLTDSDLNRLTSPAIVVDRPKEATVFNHISFELDILRNKRIIEELDKVIKSGRSPFIIYGRSHIAIIKPALDYLYGKPISIQNQ